MPVHRDTLMDKTKEKIWFLLSKILGLNVHFEKFLLRNTTKFLHKP